MSVAQGFGVAAPTDSNTQLLNDMISSHVVEQAAKERTSVVLIDDAEMLEPRAIDDLLDLVDSSSLHIVFFGEVRIVPAVERAAARFAIEWQEIRLTGFGEADARDYLEWCFQQAQYRGRLPFTDQQVKEVVKLSEGLPGRINQLANVLLVKLETGGSDDGSAKFPGLHRAILFLVVAVLGLTYLLWRQNEEAAEQAELAVLANPVAQTLPVSDNKVAQETADEAAAEGVESATVADEPAAAPQVAAEAADLQPVAEPDTVARAAPEPVAQTAQSEPVPPAPSSASPPARPQTDAVESQPSLGADLQLADAVPASRGRDAAWLLRQPVDAFTLQLLTVSTHERAVAFVDEQEYPEQFAVYRLQRDGRLLFVVVYGLFDSRDEAQSVSVNLPESISKISPWARPLGQIQDAIRTTVQ